MTPMPRSEALPRSRSWAVFSSCALSFVLGTVASPHAAGQEPTLLHGIVAEEGTGRLVGSAKVTLVEAAIETATGDDGAFAFDDAPLGRFFVRVQAAGYPTVVEEVELAPGVELFLPVF